MTARALEKLSFGGVMRYFSLLAVLLVLGCTGQIMKGYIGEPISEPILDYGPPINIVELNDGRRAYQWNIVDSGFIPVSGPNTTTYVPYAVSCVHTLIARKIGNDYIVEVHRQTSFFCD